MLWNKAFQIGNAMVDEEHRILLSKAAELLDHDQVDNESFQQLIKYLNRYVGEHFDHEEALMQKVAYPLYEEHKRIHDNFKKRLNRQLLAFADEQLHPQHKQELLRSLALWVLQHIMENDQKIGDFLRQQGYEDEADESWADTPQDLDLTSFFLGEIQVEQARMRAVVDALPYALYSVDSTSGQIIQVNTRAQQLGLSVGEVLEWSTPAPQGRRLSLMESFASAIPAALQTGKPVRQECLVTHQSQPFCYVYHAVPVKGAGGDIILIVVTMVDYTAVKRDQEQLHYASFQSGVAEMSISILHNIGNAIMSILNRAETLQLKSEELKQTAQMLEKVGPASRKRLASGQSAEQVLDTLLEVMADLGEQLSETAQSAFEQPSEQIRTSVEHISDIIKIHRDSSQYVLISEFYLKELIEDATLIQSDLLEKYGVDMVVQVSEQLPQLKLPRSQMLQMMINLIKNGLEAIAAQPEVDPGRIQITAEPIEDDRFEIRVVDNGCGIEAERLQDIFRFGVTSKASGSGFGLHTVGNFVQSLNGSIVAKSAGKGQGASFVIQLPLWAEKGQS
ncbi:hemerythrin domain-containing protein [Magnetococcus sp. PR-3]|uniref:hemerythrin domain-containing protein n=1 Tax=Magnetococcus sp. PR-3 TaxID=3120355 RepID=UPI002FCE1291